MGDISTAIIEALQQVRKGDKIAVACYDSSRIVMKGGFVHKVKRDCIILRDEHNPTSRMSKFINYLTQQEIPYRSISDLILMEQKGDQEDPFSLVKLFKALNYVP